MVKVQQVRLPESQEIRWLVLGEDFLPIRPIQEFLTYLDNIERSPNTLRSYAHHLRLYWQYLQEKHLDWTAVGLHDFAEFVHWLRQPESAIISVQPQEARRSEATINVILAAVCTFYDYQQRLDRNPGPALYREQVQPYRKYKSFLHHINKGKPVRTRLMKLKVPKRLPQTLTADQVMQLLAACHRLRDKFLISLMYESGLRVGQALGLRHEDIHSWDNTIYVVPRYDNPNRVRAKTRESYSIPVSPALMRLYTDYLVYEFDETDSDFVFVNLWEGVIGAPMRYGAVIDLFRRISKASGVPAHPHLLRHTHATDLLRSGMEAAYVQKRLGHASIQTTLDTYTHLTDDDLKQAYHTFQQTTQGERV